MSYFKDFLALVGMLLVLMAIAAIPTPHVEDLQERAVRICHQAKMQHHLIYSDARCIAAEMTLGEDNNH